MERARDDAGVHSFCPQAQGPLPQCCPRKTSSGWRRRDGTTSRRYRYAIRQRTSLWSQHEAHFRWVANPKTFGHVASRERSPPSGTPQPLAGAEKGAMLWRFWLGFSIVALPVPNIPPPATAVTQNHQSAREATMHSFALATALAALICAVQGASWAGTTPPPPPVSLLTPPVSIGSGGDTITCTCSNGSTTPITVDVAIIDRDGNVLLDAGPITVEPGAGGGFGATLEAGSTHHPSKCRFTTTTPPAVRASTIATTASGTQTFAAEPLPVLPNPPTNTQNQQ